MRFAVIPANAGIRFFLLLAALAAAPTFAADSRLAPSACPGACRAIALSPHLAELACAAGGCDRLVGAVAWSDYPERVKQLPQVGDAWAVNVERVLGLRPDLVLAWEGGTPRETIERLRGLHLRVETVAIRKLEDVPGALLRIGTLLGTAGPAGAAAAAFDTRLRTLRTRHARAPTVRVLYQIEANPPYSINRDSPISQAIELCGGQNLFADLPTLAAPVDREAIVARDPEAVLYTKQDNVAAITEFWRRAPAVTATRLGAFYALDGNLLDRATPRLLDGVEQLCAALSDARAKRAHPRP